LQCLHLSAYAPAGHDVRVTDLFRSPKNVASAPVTAAPAAAATAAVAAATTAAAAPSHGSAINTGGNGSAINTGGGGGGGEGADEATDTCGGGSGCAFDPVLQASELPGYLTAYAEGRLPPDVAAHVWDLKW
jgi:hypothetical protein